MKYLILKERCADTGFVYDVRRSRFGIFWRHDAFVHSTEAAYAYVEERHARSGMPEVYEGPLRGIFDE